MISFRIIHQEKRLLEPRPSNVSNLGLCFETCLRKIWILPEEDNLHSPSGESFVGSKAYQFLLETILGVKSPVFGETEVQGQFKEFLATSGPNFFSPWGQLLLEDAKDLRTRELQNLGCQSYGSLLREWTKGFENVVLVGHGKLAASLSPWLKKKNLFFWVRNPEKVVGYAASSLDSGFPKTFDQENTCVVIAAPLTDESLARLFNRQHFLPVYFDFRERRAASAHVYPAHKSLSDISDELAGFEQKFLKIKKVIQDRVADIAHERIHRSFHRPMGWEDLCV